MQEHTFYSPKEAAAYLGLSTISLSMWRTHGEGPAYFKSPTGRVVYHIRDLKALKAKREKAKQNPRHIRPNGEPTKRKGHASYATRLRNGERWEDLPAVTGKKREG